MIAERDRHHRLAERLDADHRRLDACLELALDAARTLDAALAARNFAAFAGALRGHIAAEERLLRALGEAGVPVPDGPTVAALRRDHEDLLRQTAAIESAFGAKRAIFEAISRMGTLRCFLSDHERREQTDLCGACTRALSPELGERVAHALRALDADGSRT